jgi:hypothetical protein
MTPIAMRSNCSAEVRNAVLAGERPIGSMPVADQQHFPAVETGVRP